MQKGTVDNKYLIQIFITGKRIRGNKIPIVSGQDASEDIIKSDSNKK